MIIIHSQHTGEVKLTQYEADMAAQVGLRRHIESIYKGRYDHLNNGSTGWNEDIEGAAAELAVAKLYGVYWDGSVNTFKKSDISFKVQVRSTHLREGKLIVRDKDPDNDVYVLVTGQIPTFKVQGGMAGHQAKQKEYLFNPPGVRQSKPAYFVPIKDLYLSVQDLISCF